MKTLTLALALTTALTAGLAQAQTMAPAQTTVRFHDLNLETPDGARVLLGRIRAAAVLECGAQPSSFLSIAAIRQHDRCADDATAAAVTRVASPTLTAMYSPSQSIALVRGR